MLVCIHFNFFCIFCRSKHVHLIFISSEKVIPDSVVIFADEYLLRLPLETLPVFNSPQVQCVARDLSLQMHYHRFHSTEVSGINISKVVKFPSTIYTQETLPWTSTFFLSCELPCSTNGFKTKEIFLSEENFPQCKRALILILNRTIF